MASNSTIKLAQTNSLGDGYTVPTSPNTFFSMWCDKRSALKCSISCTLTGATPDGYFEVQVSNAPQDQYNGSAPQGALGPRTDPVDLARLTISGAVTVSGVGTISTNVVTVAAAGATFLEISTAARWVRIKYTQSNAVSGLTAYIFASVPFESA